MKIGKLYLKIFLSFLGILVITEIVIFGLFIVFSGRHFKSRFEEYTAAKVLMVKEVVEDKIRSAPGVTVAQNQPLQKFVSQFGGILGAKVWLESADGKSTLQSFEGPIPAKSERLTRKPAKDYGNFKLYHGFGRHFSFYAIIPVEFSAKKMGSVHVLFAKGGPTGHEGGFALGLAIIGLIIALLVIPVSRLITRPLKELNHTALEIAEGDLSHRAVVKSCDEIGELGQSFNHMADRLERMIRGGRELTANISHELRTPLARMRIAEELLRQKIKKENYTDWDRHLNDIGEDIVELDRLIGQILDLSKLDLHETKLKQESLEIARVLSGLVKRLESAVAQKEIRLQTDLASPVPYRGDKEALKMAISNILNNAVKFAPHQGEIKVHMDSTEESIHINIANTFETLSEKNLEMIFEPFYRVEGSRTEGSGLGLSIAKKIIEKHGGTIEARNTPLGIQLGIQLPRV